MGITTESYLSILVIPIIKFVLISSLNNPVTNKTRKIDCATTYLYLVLYSCPCCILWLSFQIEEIFTYLYAGIMQLYPMINLRATLGSPVSLRLPYAEIIFSLPCEI